MLTELVSAVPFDQGSQGSFVTAGSRGFEASFGQAPPENERTATSGGSSDASSAFARAQAQIHNPPPPVWDPQLRRYVQGYPYDWDSDAE